MSRKSHKPGVSDHAILRYLERVLDIDLDALREHILTPEIKAALKGGAVRVRDGNGFTYLAANGCITTVLAPDMKVTHQRDRSAAHDHP